MASSAHVPGPWRNIQTTDTAAGPGFQFTGNPAPDNGVRGYELTEETVLMAAHAVEWMYDPTTGALYSHAEQAFKDLTSAVAVRGLTGNDDTTGSDYNDIFAMGAGNDQVFARAGDDLIRGGDGNDVLHGQQGNDVIDGGSGVDQMFGGEGDDVFFVDDARDWIVEGSGAGNDTVLTSVSYALAADVWVEVLATTADAGTDPIHLTGNDYAQIIRGNAGANVLSGLGGEDTLHGGGGNDVLIGGAGDDTLHGGDGTDSALFSGFRTQYAIVGTAAQRVVNSIAEGTDILEGIEHLVFTDGRLVFDVADRAAAVYRMYDSMFARAPDFIGFNYWIDTLESGLGVEGMAQSFAGSTEFVQKYGNLSNQGFVEQLYMNVLDRPGEAGGVGFWSAALDAGGVSRGQVLAGFSESAEHVEMLRADVELGLWDMDGKAAQMARLYSAAFDRRPDAGGLGYWTNIVKSGAADALQVADLFAGSQEFVGLYGSLNNAQFVDRLYQNVLDRPADAGGLAFWSHLLDTGSQDRGNVLMGFSDSNENRYKTAPDMDHGVLLA